MSVRVGLRFAVGDEGIDAIPFARLMCDLQHLSLMVVSLAMLDEYPGTDVLPTGSAVFDPALQKYTVFIETRVGAFGVAEVHVVRIEQQSPTLIEFVLRIPKTLNAACVRAWKFIFERVLYGDIEREKRRADVDSMREDVLRKRLENLAAAYDLSARIQDPYLRERFLRSFESSLAPFGTDHPQITDGFVRDDDPPEPSS